MHKAIVTASFVVATIAAAAPTFAQYDKTSTPPLSSAMTSTCGLGNAPLTQGSTPTAIAGVTIVSAQQSKCLMDNYGQSLLVIGAMSDLDQLPDAYPVPILGYDKADAEFEKRFASDFEPLTGGRKDRPVLIYCHHASCQYSANGSEHLARMGYSRIYWLRDGTSGWSKAGYKLTETPRIAPGSSAAVAYFKKASGYTFGCFGESKAAACEAKIGFEEMAYNAADIKPTEKPIVLDALLNTVASYISDLRTGGVSSYFPEPRFPKDPKKALELVASSLELMRNAQANGSHSNAVANNLKLQTQAVLSYAEAGLWSDVDATLKFARGVADTSYAGLEKARPDKTKLDEVLKQIVGAEKLEEEISATLGKMAIEAYKSGTSSQASKLGKMAHNSYDRRAIWVARAGNEGVAGFADMSPESRLAELKLEQAELYLAANDKAAAATTYRAARAVSCPYVSDATWQMVEARQPINDTQQFVHARGCENAEFGEMKATGELDRLIEKQTDAELRLQYEILGLDYDKLKAKAKKK